MHLLSLLSVRVGNGDGCKRRCRLGVNPTKVRIQGEKKKEKEGDIKA